VISREDDGEGSKWNIFNQGYRVYVSQILQIGSIYTVYSCRWFNKLKIISISFKVLYLWNLYLVSLIFFPYFMCDTWHSEYFLKFCKCYLWCKRLGPIYLCWDPKRLKLTKYIRLRFQFDMIFHIFGYFSCSIDVASLIFALIRLALTVNVGFLNKYLPGWWQHVLCVRILEY
jgi:hypothetical protein